MFQSYIRITSSIGAIQKQFGYLDMYTNAISKKLKSHHALIHKHRAPEGDLIFRILMVLQTSRSDGACLL